MNWTQIRTVLWLRWRLTRNQWSRGGQLNAILTLIVAVIALVIGLSGVVLGATAGVFAFKHSSPLVLLLVWDGFIGAFLFLWMMGVLAELQRSEAIDLSRLLHLPVSLQGIFIVNYLASHLSFSVILFLPGMLGLAVGLALSKGPAMLWLVPLVLSVIFMVTAWTYCLRGWLILLMVNQRRRRAVLVAVTLGIMILAQLPNLYFNVFGHRGKPQPPGAPNQSQTVEAEAQKRARHPAFLAAHYFIPVLWPGNGAMSLAVSNPWPAIWGVLGSLWLDQFIGNGAGNHQFTIELRNNRDGFAKNEVVDGAAIGDDQAHKALNTLAKLQRSSSSICRVYGKRALFLSRNSSASARVIPSSSPTRPREISSLK